MLAWKWQFLRFVLVGGAAAAVDFASFALLAHAAGLHPLAANSVSRPLGGLTSFLLNKYWTFQRPERRTLAGQGARYLATWLACFFGSQLMVGLYHEILRLSPVPAKLAAEATVGLFSFLAQRLWVFRTR